MPLRVNIARMLTFTEERAALALGYSRPAGIDEVGRGCIAGPLVAAAVIMPFKRKPVWYTKVNDSKQLTPRQREALEPRIRESALGIGIGTVSVEIVDSQGMTRATELAMKQAVGRIQPPPDYLLIDYFVLTEVSLPQKGVKDGDSLCFSIACASIVAKVFRDRLMDQLDETYPGYLFCENKGYGTREHMACLRKMGPSAVHRRSFGPVADVIRKNVEF